MRERDVERKLVRAVRDAGGLALKFVSPGMAGVPDRLLLFPGGRAVFCEVKAPGEKPRPLQVHRMDLLRGLGFKVYIADNQEQIEWIISDVIPTGAEGGAEGSLDQRKRGNRCRIHCKIKRKQVY